MDIPGVNSLLVLLRHVGGSARYWLDHVCLGNEDVRDRSDEFSASGPVAEEMERHAAQREVIVAALEKLRDADPQDPPAAPPTDKERWWLPTIGGVMVHVYNECAQHLGHLEITRDALAAGLPRAYIFSTPRAASTSPWTVFRIDDGIRSSSRFRNPWTMRSRDSDSVKPVDMR